MAKDAKVRVTLSVDQEVLDLLDRYAEELHLSRSGFVSFMVTQIDQVVRVTGPEVRKDEAGPSGES